MGLSSKQVSSDGLGWSQSLLQAQTLELPKASEMKRQQPQNHQQQQQSEPLKCPRCDSSNTKFCYYNNYNKSQPRHFCKSCKRHWTKGGTLRNVPVGGGRKNKRLKTSKTNTAAVATTPASTNTTSSAIKSSTTSGVNNRLNNLMAIQPQQQRQDLQLPLSDQKDVSNMQFQGLSRPPSSFLQQNSISCSNLDSIKSFSTSNGAFLRSTLSLPQTQGLQFPFPFSSSSSSSFDTIPSSISTSLQSSSIYNYTGETMEDPTITSIIVPTTVSQPWQVPITSSGMDMTNYWNWADIDALASTDLNMPWDDSEIKP
ncbi:hypothetical protein REPUB_Repub14bG0129200 [Reevesia pubescens]